MLKIFEVIGSVAQCLIPFLAYWKGKKEAKLLETVATGVERFSKAKDSQAKGKELKDTIRALAQESGLENRLNKKIQKFQIRLWKKLF